MAGYDRWVIDVRDEVPSDRLVEWQPGDGWEPLCRALDGPKHWHVLHVIARRQSTQDRS